MGAAASARPSPPDSATSLAVADMNGDGAADLVTVRGEYGHVDVLLNDGCGHFRARRSWSDTTWLTVRAAGDLDGDGHAAVADRGKMGTERRITLLRGDGRGGLATWARVEIPRSDRNHVVIADADGDGRPDIVAATARYRNRLVALLGTGGSRFRRATGRWPSALAIADLNGDGHPDVATANEMSDDLGVLLGRGDGTFRQGATIRLRLPPR
jgi:hypothetical protein